MSRSIILAALAAVVLAGAAQAEPSAIAVSAKGLDLSTLAEAKAFYRRLAIASAQICGGTSTYFIGERPDRFENCYQATLTQAVAHAHAPLMEDQLNRTSPRTAGR